jgi:hypothetical protein
MKGIKHFWPHFIVLALIEGLIALALMFTIPGERLSLARLFLAGILILILAGLTWLFIRARNVDWRIHWLETDARPRFFLGLIFASALLSLTSGLLLFLLRYFSPETTASYFVRARPLLIFLLLLGVQTCLWLAWLRNGFHPATLRNRRGVFASAAVVFAVFIVIWLLILLTELGITKDPSYWAEPGVPILGWQLMLALLLGFGFLLFNLRRDLSPRADLLIAGALWLLAFGLWMSVPLISLRHSFYAPIQPPYDQPFPNSDAAYYDSDAQSLLLGYGFLHKIPTRPLYIIFLTGLHALFGQEYARLVFGQTLILALFPVVLYYLGKRLHSRAAGLTVALLAILRELTSLWVASDARVSNTKMLLSDIITTLVLVAYLLVVLRWFGQKRGGFFLAFVCGGLLGLLILLRSQSAFIAPGVLLLALPIFWPDWKKWIAQSFLFAAGMILAVTPWLVRNYSVTGQVSLDDPVQILSVASMYSGGTPTSNYSLFDGQTTEQVSRYVMDTIIHKPGYVAGFVSNQFLANTIDTLLVLPIFARYDGLTAPIHLYWYEWDGHISASNVMLFIVYLTVIAVGLAAAWKRLRWAGLLPLTLFLFYNFSTSLARYSGWRYIFPADWVGYYYFALGTIELTTMGAVLFGAKPERSFSASDAELSIRPVPTWHAVAFACAIILVGSLPWIVESSVPQSQPICSASLVDCLVEQGADTSSKVQAFLAQPEAVGLAGRVLYPRYFSRNDGLPSTNPAPAFAPRDFPRMGFFLLTSEGVTQSILPMRGSRPFPHAADAILLGCQRDRYVEVRMIVFPASGEIFASDSLAAPCAVP